MHHHATTDRLVGIMRWRYQLLRISELSAKVVGLRVLAEMAGHASIQTTQLYIDVNDEQMRRAAELI